FFFFFTAYSTSDIYTLSLHDALPILFLKYRDMCDKKYLYPGRPFFYFSDKLSICNFPTKKHWKDKSKIQYIEKGIDSIVNYYLEDRKSTRLNSSHVSISYAVFCLKKK